MEGLRSSTATSSYHSGGANKYMIFSRQSYVSGSRYTSPIQSLVPEDPKGLRCFFIYDFNPHRELPDPFPQHCRRGLDPEINYPQSASQIADEVIGGLSCWRVRFDLPAMEEDIERCNATLMDGRAVISEVYYFLSRSLECQFGTYTCC